MTPTGEPMGVAVIGCGLIGRRRAVAAAAHAESRVAVVVDTDRSRARELAEEVGADHAAAWQDAIRREDVQAVAVCTPNAHLLPIGAAALDAGRHVLLEKPMGRNLAEARRLAAAAGRSDALLKVGFNHREHPGIRRAKELVDRGEIGRIIHIRARYGHGSRPGCEREWRADPELAGGGELTDQGVHLIDLIHWFMGVPGTAFAVLQTAVWPLKPLEDNAFALFRWLDGRVAQFHVSMTQWKNLFSFEVVGELGSLTVEGLGGSYGPERLVHTRRRLEGGVPEQELTEFAGPDESWQREWAAFVRGVDAGGMADAGPEDGVTAMRMLDALYRSAASERSVAVAG